LQYDPDYAGAYVALASVYTTLRRPEDAIRTLKNGSSLMPLFWAANYEMARALASEGNYAAALHQIERASSLAPRPDPLFRLAKADILLGLSDDLAAASELRAYLREDPNGRNAPQARTTLKRLESSAPH
jgi:tetratricopeptide (TPR) repeat protein